MKLLIKGEPREIADFVLAVQSQLKEKIKHIPYSSKEKSGKVDSEKPEQLPVEVVIIENDGIAYIMNLERKTSRVAPIWTEERWREHIYQTREKRSGSEITNWLRQLDETQKNNQSLSVQPEQKDEE